MPQTSKINRQSLKGDQPTVSAIVESLLDPACLIRPDGQVLVINSLFAARFGKATDACIERSISDLAVACAPMQSLAVSLSENASIAFREGRLVAFDDRDSGWKVTINPVRNAAGEITSLLVSARDFSEQTPTNEEAENFCMAALSMSLQAAHAGVWEWNPKSGELIAPEQTWSMSGIEQGGPLSSFDRFLQSVHPGDQDQIKTLVEQIARGVSKIDTEFRIVQPDGSIRWFMSRGKSVLDREGHPERSVGLIVDITERKHLEEELRKNKALMDQALNVSRAGVWEKDFRDNSLYWSDTMWNLFGLDPSGEQLTFDLWKSALHPDDRKVIEESGRAIRAGEELNVEYRVRDADGSIRWLMSRGLPVRNEDGGFERYIGTVIDITNRKLLEEALLESKARYRYALDAAHAGIWEWIVRTDELRWSEQVWRLYGLSPDSLPINHQMCVDTVHAEDRQMVSQLIRKGAAKCESVVVEYRITRPDGSVRWLISRGMPIFDERGELERYIGTIIDITERKQIELDLLDSRKRLDLALEAARAGVWEWNLETGENIWSDEVWALYGLSRGAGLKPSFDLWVDSIHPEDRERAIWVFTAASRQKRELDVEFRTIHDDGSIHWLMARGQPRQDEQDKTVGYIGTVIDITEQKLAEIRLRENKVRFNFALEATGAGIWEWDVASDRLFWSDQIWQLYGLRQQGSISSYKFCSTNVHPEDHALISGTILNAVNKKEDFTVEYRVCLEGGAVRWLLCRGVLFPVSPGEPTRYLGMVMDITVRRQAEEEWRKSREQLDLVLEKGNIGVMTVDLKTLVGKRSLQYARLFGYDSLEGVWTLSSFLEHVVPEERQSVGEKIEHWLQTHETHSFECRIRTADGRLRWLWVFGAFSYDNSTGDDYLLRIVQDITERKQAELFLKESEEKFRNIFELSPVAIGIGNIDDGRLFDVNAAFLGLFGLTHDKVIGKELGELELFPHPAEYEGFISDFLKHGRIGWRQLELTSRSAKTLTVLFSAETITIAGQNHILMMMTDITMQELQQASINQLEQAVVERTEQLREEVERLSRFLSMISHEYRTPLAIIRGNLDLIDLKARAGDYSHEREMDKIRQAIERLVEVMEVSIQESRLRESRDEQLVTNFPVEPVIRSQLEAFRSIWPERTINVTGQIGEAEVIGEQGQFGMAIFNLLDNARKYSPPDSPIGLEYHLEKDEVLITIRNEGNSIPDAEFDELFEKYRRGGNAANTAGAGIGLWLVRDIIERHQGRVTLSGVSSGVEAVIRLPLARQVV